jgi:uncharacterized protein involved in exopolysaccharide biosynthesis
MEKRNAMSGQDLLAYLGIIKKRLWLVGLLMVVTVGTIFGFFFTAKPTYSASVQFLVTAPPTSDVSLYSGFRTPSAREEIVYTSANFVEVLRSGTVAWKTVEEQGISMRGGELLKRMQIENLASSEFIRLTVTADTAEEAQLLVNGLIENALRHYGELRAKPTTNSLNFISTQLENAQQDLETAEQRLLQFQTEHHMGDLESEINSLQALIRSLRLQRDQAEAESNLPGEQAEKNIVAAYDEIIAERERELQTLLLLNAEYTTLKGQVGRAQSLYNLLLDKQTEAKLKENEVRNADFIQVMEPAQLPRRPNSPFNVKIIIVGTVASLIMGVLLAFVLEYVERLRVFSPPKEASITAAKAESPVQDALEFSR